jgi:ABC-type transporter Mla subunit MlaD
MNPQSDCTTPTKKQTKALRQAQRRADPVKRRLEQSSDTVRRRSARINQTVQEHEQLANTVRRGIARDEPGELPMYDISTL